MDTKPLVEDLKKYRANGGTWKDLARRTGVTDATISRAVSGKSRTDIDTWLKLHQKAPDVVRAPALTVEAWFPREFYDPARAQERPPQPAHDPAGVGPTMVVKVNNQATQETLEGQVENYRGIPLYESGRLAAGVNGLAFDPDEEPASTVVVYQPELRGRSGHHLAALRVGGVSMSPTIPQGSIVVVDLSDKAFVPRKIYVVNDLEDGGPGQAAVKRVQRWTNGFVLVSDNPDFSPEVLETDWPELCVGRVIWMWRSMEEV